MLLEMKFRRGLPLKQFNIKFLKGEYQKRVVGRKFYWAWQTRNHGILVVWVNPCWHWTYVESCSWLGSWLGNDCNSGVQFI